MGQGQVIYDGPFKGKTKVTWRGKVTDGLSNWEGPLEVQGRMRAL